MKDDVVTFVDVDPFQRHLGRLEGVPRRRGDRDAPHEERPELVVRVAGRRLLPGSQSEASQHHPEEHLLSAGNGLRLTGDKVG